ncbi:MAG: hypothetical protein JNL87_07665 [Burkholderiaceae bacterium]|nr:hypothetical protein [Burkholderiaceae bacterium]
MTDLIQAAAGTFGPARCSRAIAGTVLTAVLALVFGLSVMVELSNAPDLATPAAAPALAATTASADPAPRLNAGEDESAAF